MSHILTVAAKSNRKLDRIQQNASRLILSKDSTNIRYDQRMSNLNLVPRAFPSLKKMGGAGKGPGIGWSRAQPKYS